MFESRLGTYGMTLICDFSSSRHNILSKTAKEVVEI